MHLFGMVEFSTRHGPVAGTVNAAMTALAVASVAHAAGLWWLWLVLAGLASATAAAAAARRSGLSRAGVRYRAVCWLAATGWVGWVTSTTPWQVTRLALLAGGALALGLLAPAMGRRERSVRERAARVRNLSERREVADEWVDRIARVCGIKGVETVGLKAWEWQVKGESSGFTLDLDMPPGGKGWKDIQQFAEQLANDAQLPDGCGVEARKPKGVHRGAVELDVMTVNALAADVWYPDDYSKLTVNEPWQLGVHRNGKPAVGEFRQSCCLICGQTGSGKSNTMNVCIACAALCVDVLPMVIDINGGGLGLPWALPWWESLDTDEPLAAPAIDWLAADGDEALRMAQVALAIARGRKTRYQQLMRQVDDDKVPVSCDLPLVLLFVDEIAVIMGEGSKYPELRDTLKLVQNEGRGGGVRVVFGALRATVEMIGGANVKKQSALRIGMKVTDPEELDFLFGSRKGLTPEDMPYPGCGAIAQGQDAPRPFKVSRLTPSRIKAVAVAASEWRPGLDAVSVDIAETVYPGFHAGRWERAAPYLDAASGGSPAPIPQSPAGADVTTGRISPSDARKRLDDARQRLRDKVARREAENAGGAAEPGPADLADLDEIDRLATEWAGAAEPPGGSPGPDPKKRFFALLWNAGPAGTTATDIQRQLAAEGYSTTRQTVSDWLGAAVAAGLVVQPVKRGPYIIRDFTGGDGE